MVTILRSATSGFDCECGRHLRTERAAWRHAAKHTRQLRRRRIMRRIAELLA